MSNLLGLTSITIPCVYNFKIVRRHFSLIFVYVAVVKMKGGSIVQLKVKNMSINPKHV